MNMQYFRYKADRIPVFIFLLLFISDVVVYLCVSDPRLLLLWLALVIAPKACICSWNHHHQHLATFLQKPLNRLLEFVYAFHTGITTNAWVLHHNLGHHVNYLDQNKDESGWKRRDGRTMGEIEYTLTIAITGYLRALRVGLSHNKYLPAFFGMGTLVLLSLGLLTYHNWLNAIFVFWIPMISGYIITCWHTYAHHAGLDTSNHLEASHNIMHPFYNLMTGNLGYHTAHHMKAGLHWSMLPEFHATIAEQIPAKLFVDPPAPFLWLSPKKQMNQIMLNDPA